MTGSTEHTLVVTAKTLVEGDSTVVVGTFIPVKLECPAYFLSLLVTFSDELLEFRHCVVVRTEL